MTDLRTAAQQALEALEFSWGGEPMGTLERDAITALKAALATQSTHSADCYKWHHECAIARIEDLKLLCEEMLSELYVYRASKHLKDATAAITKAKSK